MNINLFVTSEGQKKIFPISNLQAVSVGNFKKVDVADNYPSDNTGDNIADRYYYYGNLTALYWIWKNRASDSEYIGFMNSQNIFIFNENFSPAEVDDRKLYGDSSYVFENINEDIVNTLGYNEDIREKIKNYDAVFPQKSNVKILEYASLEEKILSSGVSKKLYDSFISAIAELFPEYSDFLNAPNSIWSYPHNVFILRKELFFA